MKSLIVPLLATASFSTFLICGMVGASSMQLGLDYSPHKFANINSSIWTSTPLRVERSADAYAPETTTQPVATAAMESVANIQPVEQEANSGSNPQLAMASANTDSIGWCQARYRSYRVSDNSYQPLGGGPRQQCDAPSQAGISSATVESSSAAFAQNIDVNHTDWCQARYSSYRISDDTYQPFGSSDRRRCMSPASMASNG